MSKLKNSIGSMIGNVTKEWKKEKNKKLRDDRVERNRLARMRTTCRETTTREAAFTVMETAYNKASSNGKYYANARQIMYAARPYILDETGKDTMDSGYFTQTLLKDYIERYGKEAEWKVAWDARGHFSEPHTDNRFGVGGIEVTKYMGSFYSDLGIKTPRVPVSINTTGPENRYKSVLFVEKEGFTEMLEDSGILRQFDMALMSTKGLPVKAACDLIFRLSAEGVRVFVLRDFDLAGFKIVRTLTKGTRMAHGSPVIDLGFRLEDTEGLDPEPVIYKQRKNPKIYLRNCGATEEEANFLVDSDSYLNHSGQRVELNAMTSEQLIDFLHRKFKEHGVEKYVPSDNVLKKVYQRACYARDMHKKIAELDKTELIDPPDELHEQITAKLKEKKGISWDQAVWEVCQKSG